MTSGPETESRRSVSPGGISRAHANHGKQAAPRVTRVKLLRYRQAKIVVLLFGGYAACYFCRADLSVATPLLVEELGKHGVSHAEAIVRVGGMSS
jgi:sugar phosphate permease